MRIARAVADLGGIGRLRPGPGTWGSAAVLWAAMLGPLPCLGLAVGCAAAGLWALPRVPEAVGDPGWVVIDEAAGQLLALAALPAGAGLAGVLLAFALFRVLDIAKPGPIGWADRQPGAVGVLLDDLVAGAIAGAALVLVRVAYPGGLS